MKEIFFYCDGASFNNGAKNKNLEVLGSYGAFIVDSEGNTLLQFSDVFENVTNNQMELYGFIKLITEFLIRYKGSSKYTINIISDSQYLVKGINEWLPNWKRKGWKNSTGKIVENINLWRLIDKILELNKVIKLNFIWQKGHKGKSLSKSEDINAFYNECCDSLATESLSNYRSLESNNNSNSLNFNEVIKKIDIYLSKRIKEVLLNG